MAWRFPLHDAVLVMPIPFNLLVAWWHRLHEWLAVPSFLSRWVAEDQRGAKGAMARSWEKGFRAGYREGRVDLARELKEVLN